MNTQLTHEDLRKGRMQTLWKLASYEGPVKGLLEHYAEHFLRCARLRRVSGQAWYLELWLDGEPTTRSDTWGPSGKLYGPVTEEWARSLEWQAFDLWRAYQVITGGITSEPPGECPNVRHVVQWESVSSPEWVPDSGHWRCIGCGWLVDSDGVRVREEYDMAGPEVRPGQRSTGFTDSD